MMAPHEPASDRSTVAPTPTNDGLIRIRTPEGETFIIPPERALEWCSSRRFIDAMRRAVMECRGGIALKAKEEGS